MRREKGERRREKGRKRVALSSWLSAVQQAPPEKRLRPLPGVAVRPCLLWVGISVSHPSCHPVFVLPSPLQGTMLLAGLAAVPLLPVC